jgi:L-ribulokinase
MVKIMGTSTCDIIVAPLSQELPFIPGLCGIVPETVLPKHHGLEAGQSAVGDLFHWWVDHVLEHSSDSHESLTEAAEKLQPGESGLLALDWNNGNRCLLCDPLLTGVLLGQTLQTQAHEIYRALIEATAFGARMILERIERYGIVVDTIIACGGLASNNPMLMQIYADITGRNIQVSKSSQTCALGSAIAASVAAKIHPDIGTAQSKMCQQAQKQYSPASMAADVYDSLYVLYVKLHDHFGGNQEPTSSLSDLMKSLQHIKSKACHS